MKKVNNIKKGTSLLVATAIVFALTGCGNKKIDTEVNQLSSNKEVVQNQKPELTATLNPTLEPTLEPTVEPIVEMTSLERSKLIKEASNPLTKMREVYDMVGEEFTSNNGYVYRYVSVKNDDGYVAGLFNMNTLNEDIPCKTYDYMSEEFVTSNNNIYRVISVPNDQDYAAGVLNMVTLKEDIPCRRYPASMSTDVIKLVK